MSRRGAAIRWTAIGLAIGLNFGNAGPIASDLAAAFGDVYLIAALVALAGLLPALAMRAGAPTEAPGVIVAAERNAPSAGT